MSRVDTVRAARRRTWEHILSERGGDVDAVMPTVSADVFYVMPDLTRGDDSVVVLTTREQVRAFYDVAMGSVMDILDNTPLVEWASDWYLFLESVSTTRDRSSGAVHRNLAAVLFPVADDGITAEILCLRRSWADVYGGVAEASDRAAPDAALVIERHKAYLDALQRNDAASAAAVFTAGAAIAVRTPAAQGPVVVNGTGAVAVRERCAVLNDGISDAEYTLLTRVVEDWFLFAEWVVRGTRHGSPIELRCASIHPLTADGLFAGERGYAMVAP